MTNGYPIFGWSSIIPIMNQAGREPENEEASFHSNEENDDIIEYVEGEGKLNKKNTSESNKIDTPQVGIVT